MTMLAEYLILALPGAFPWFYLITLGLLMALRFTTYRAIHNHYFMLDFCYFVNISVVIQALLFPATSSFGATWFKANFVLSHGPIGEHMALANRSYMKSLIWIT
jgi:hypothetical protein